MGTINRCVEDETSREHYLTRRYIATIPVYWCRGSSNTNTTLSGQYGRTGLEISGTPARRGPLHFLRAREKYFPHQGVANGFPPTICDCVCFLRCTPVSLLDKRTYVSARIAVVSRFKEVLFLCLPSPGCTRRLVSPSPVAGQKTKRFRCL